MVKKEVLNNSTDSSEYCVAEGGETEDSIGGGEYVWSETLQGVVSFLEQNLCEARREFDPY